MGKQDGCWQAGDDVFIRERIRKSGLLGQSSSHNEGRKPKAEEPPGSQSSEICAELNPGPGLRGDAALSARPAPELGEPKVS
jgi:hypothetical protein